MGASRLVSGGTRLQRGGEDLERAWRTLRKAVLAMGLTILFDAVSWLAGMEWTRSWGVFNTDLTVKFQGNNREESRVISVLIPCYIRVIYESRAHAFPAIDHGGSSATTQRSITVGGEQKTDAQRETLHSVRGAVRDYVDSPPLLSVLNPFGIFLGNDYL